MHKTPSFISLNTLLTFKLKIISDLFISSISSEINASPFFFYFIGIFNVNFSPVFLSWFAYLSRTFSSFFFLLLKCSNLPDKWIWYCLHLIPENRSTNENTIIRWFLSADEVSEPVGSLVKILTARLCFLVLAPQINPSHGLSLQFFLSVLSWVADSCLDFWFKALVPAHVLCTINLCYLSGLEFLVALICSLSQVSQGS